MFGLPEKCVCGGGVVLLPMQVINVDVYCSSIFNGIIFIIFPLQAVTFIFKSLGMKCVTYLSQVKSVIFIAYFQIIIDWNTEDFVSVIGIIIYYCILYVCLYFQIMPSFLNVIRTCDSSFREVCEFWKSLLWVIAVNQYQEHHLIHNLFFFFPIVCTSATRSADFNCQATYQELLGWNIWSNQGVVDLTINKSSIIIISVGEFSSKTIAFVVKGSILTFFQEDVNSALSVTNRVTKISFGELTSGVGELTKVVGELTNGYRWIGYRRCDR